MYRKILVAVENSPADQAILGHVRELAALTGAELLLVHVADGWAARHFDHLKLRESEEMRADRAYLAQLAESLPNLKVTTELAMGDPANELIRLCRGARGRPDRHVHARPPLPERSDPRHHRQQGPPHGAHPGPAAQGQLSSTAPSARQFTSHNSQVTNSMRKGSFANSELLNSELSDLLIARPHSSSDASRAPSTSDSSFAHITCGCTRWMCSICAKPQSVPAMTFSRPTIFASRTMRSATRRGCSTVVVWWVMTPGIRIFPGGSFDVLPDAPLVLVARVGALDQVGAGAHAQHQVHDRVERRVGDVRHVPAAEADVIADAILRDVGAAPWFSASTRSSAHSR